jgi:hypothetical protein
MFYISGYSLFKDSVINKSGAQAYHRWFCGRIMNYTIILKILSLIYLSIEEVKIAYLLDIDMRIAAIQFVINFFSSNNENAENA